MLVVFGGHNESMRKHLLIRNLRKFVVSWLPKVSINSWMQCRLCRATSHKLYVPWERLCDIIIEIIWSLKKKLLLLLLLVLVIMLSKSQFGLDIHDISTKFKQCQVVVRQCLKNSENQDINQLHHLSNDKSKQYDSFNSTRNILKSIRQNMSEKVKKDLTTQGLVVRHAWDLTLTSTKSIWCTVQKYMPKNIFNFTIRYLNNTLSNMSNMHIWGYSENKLCVLCHQVQTLGHVVAGCNVSLADGRYTWRHNSVLQVIANSLTRFCSNLFADLPSFASPCIITGEQERPDIVIVQQKAVMLLELTIGFETNMELNSTRKREKYKALVDRLKKSYDDVVYANISMRACGFIEKDSKKFLDIMTKLKIPETEIQYLTKSIINVCIRTSYFIFCRRNKEWTKPELLSFWTIIFRTSITFY